VGRSGQDEVVEGAPCPVLVMEGHTVPWPAAS
jgi:hypothetical protein